MVLKYAGRIKFREIPVLQVVDQDPALSQESFVDAEVPWGDDVKEVTPRNPLTEIQADYNRGQNDENTCPVAIQCRKPTCDVDLPLRSIR
jgi:hypothetical protein